MKEYKVSVIIPVYNAEKTLGLAVESLLKSDTDALQIILTDDGSSDSSASICDKLAAQCDNITVIRKSNGGVASARNAGLDAATGEWIGFLDADDTVEPDMYEHLIAEAEKHSTDIAQCASFIDSNGSSKVVFSPKSSLLISTDDKRFGKLYTKHASYGSCCKIFRRSAIGEVRFDEATAIGEDLRFNLDMIVKCKKILICPKPLYHYLQHSASATHTTTTKNLTSFRSMIKRAELDFEGYTALRPIIYSAVLLDASDTASKLVLSGIKDEKLFSELRTDIKSKISSVIFGNGISAAQRFKLLLIAYLPRLYRSLLIKYKGKRGNS